uniref:Uncharacterized protein n=1 Tax=Lygus hesperus TaxID=30085 RepID=A0A146KWQ1_LYGHE
MQQRLLLLANLILITVNCSIATHHPILHVSLAFTVWLNFTFLISVLLFPAVVMIIIVIIVLVLLVVVTAALLLLNLFYYLLHHTCHLCQHRLQATQHNTTVNKGTAKILDLMLCRTVILSKKQHRIGYILLRYGQDRFRHRRQPR